MAKRRKQGVKHKPGAFDNDWLGLKLPVLSTLKDCQQTHELATFQAF